MIIIVKAFKVKEDSEVYSQKASTDGTYIDVLEKSGPMIAAAVQNGADFIAITIIR